MTEPRRWIEVRVRAPAETRDDVVAALVSCGAPGVQELASELLTHVSDDTDLAALARAVEAASPGAAVEHRALEEGDWSAPARARVGVQRVGRIAVGPPWLAHDIAGAELPIVIEPAMAFGTGDHETTRGMLALLQQVVQPGDFVADLGAGSAVLAIAAARLGAARVAAIEIDPQAIGNAEENVALNGVAARVSVIEGDAAVLLPLVAPVNVILANIISSVLGALSPVMRAALAPGGRAVIGGILVSEREDALGWLARDGWSVETELREGDWWSSVIAPR
ncbi:MAG TPA: 50S ribosomal protein L11 methyltransferase [Gemmatimonadaceae bacterium]